MDAYYHDLSHLTHHEREVTNFDHPDALDIERFAEDLARWKRGLGIEVPCYDFTTHCRREDCVAVEPGPCLIVDGILLGASISLRALYDQVIFVDTPLDVCLMRRIARDVRDRGRTKESVLLFWRERALPMFLIHGQSIRDSAHLVLDGTSPVDCLLNEALASVTFALAAD
jgi:uridine kinase